MMNVKLKKYAGKASIGLGACAITFSVYGKCLGDPTAPSPLKIYVVPQLTATQIYVNWAPLLERLGYQTKQCFELNIPTNIPQFEADLNNGIPDFAYMNPYHAVMKWRESQYVPLVASGEPIYGVLTVRRDSMVQNIGKLSGEKIGFPAPNAFAASLLIRATLALERVAFEPVYLKTHSNVYRSVILGDVVAGGGIQSTLSAEPSELRAELRVLMETKRYTAHPFSANSRVPVNLQRQIQEALLEIAQTSEGSKLLEAAQLKDLIPVTIEANYLPLEILGLEKFVVRNAN